MKVGGLMGFGKDTIKGCVEIQRGVYISGEEIPVTITADFSKTKQACVEYKAYIMQHCQFKGGACEDVKKSK